MATSIPIIVFFIILLGGVLLIAASQSGFSGELTRLSKQQNKFKSKTKPTEEINLFVTQRTNFLATLLDTAGLENQYDKMRMYWGLSIFGGGLIFAGGCAYMSPMLAPIAFFFGLPFGGYGFIFALKKIAKNRQAKMTAQLPQILETMVSSLRAGSPIIEVFKLLSETAPEPIRGEFKRGLVSLQLGKPFRESLKEMSLRIKAADFRLLITAIFISQDVGGNLADVIAEIADAIRERFKLRDYMDSLTSQGKATAMFIGSLPYFITLLTYTMAPNYIMPFLNNFFARIALAVFVIWELIGFYILMKMTTFEV